MDIVFGLLCAAMVVVPFVMWCVWARRQANGG